MPLIDFCSPLARLQMFFFTQNYFKLQNKTSRIQRKKGRERDFLKAKSSSITYIFRKRIEKSEASVNDEELGNMGYYIVNIYITIRIRIQMLAFVNANDKPEARNPVILASCCFGQTLLFGTE